MINFIVCDNESLFVDQIMGIIDTFMMNNDLAYSKHPFYAYNEEFMEIMTSSLSFKIYILDIEVEEKSGIDIARQIRKIDTDSMIIFCTAYLKENLQDIIRNKLMYLDFIDKSEEEYMTHLKNTIAYAVETVGKKNIIRFKSENVIYTILTNDILYIVRGKDRKCKIKTTDNDFLVNKTLLEFMDKLENQFIYSHRACIVNTDRIYSYDKKNKVIVFDTEEELNVVSLRFQIKYQEVLENKKKDLHFIDFIDKI